MLKVLKMSVTFSVNVQGACMRLVTEADYLGKKKSDLTETFNCA